MAPNASSASPHVNDEEYEKAHLVCPKEVQAKIESETREINKQLGIVGKFKPRKRGLFEFETEILWTNTIALVALHVICFYYLATFPWRTKWHLFIWAYFMGMVGGFGVTGGAHRYWTHKSYKANIPFRIILMMCYCSAGQNTIYEWVRDHRVHHKFSETDADPHNSKRGFFFAHMGWLMMRKHPEVIRKGREIDMSDVLEDPVVVFAQKYFIPLKLLLGFVIPAMLPILIWNEGWYMSIVTQCFLRYPLMLNFTWSVNSLAHIWGNKPYDKNISPSENRLVSWFAMGEGWHNYHHVFPWDYKAAELGPSLLNITTAIIDLFAKIGWVWDRKQPTSELVKAVVDNRGDGTHHQNHRQHPCYHHRHR